MYRTVSTSVPGYSYRTSLFEDSEGEPRYVVVMSYSMRRNNPSPTITYSIDPVAETLVYSSDGAGRITDAIPLLQLPSVVDHRRAVETWSKKKSEREDVQPLP